jgi:RNA polymerase sigma-70 factor (ECF subfamily)
MYWSHRITKHTRVKGGPAILLAGDYNARSSERDEFIDTFEQPTPEVPCVDPEAIHRLCNRLPAHERSLVDLMFFQNLPIREAAAQLGISKTTAHRQLGEALRRLRDWLRSTETAAARA